MFDAELYLRLVGERMLEGAGHGERSPLRAAGDALLAVGRVDQPTLDAVLDDYRLASSLRGAEHFFFEEGFESGAATEPLAPQRVVRCQAEIALSSCVVDVRYACLSERSTALAATLRMDPPAGRRRGRAAMIGFTGPPTVTLTDDRGTTSTAMFGGGGSDTEWEGRFAADDPLAPDTRFIELDGHRLDLIDAPPSVQVWLEPLPDTSSAIGYLWACVTPDDDFYGEAQHEHAIDALIAAGVVARDDPALAEVRKVGEAIAHGALHGAPPPSGLSEPWKTVLGRGPRRKGPVGLVPVGAATPLFDGIAVAVSVLDSQEDGWQIEADVAPAGAMFGGARRLRWWAADDRGNDYLGQSGSWGADDGDVGSGEIHFNAPLDPKATYVDLRPTGRTQRAVIRVALEWP